MAQIYNENKNCRNIYEYKHLIVARGAINCWIVYGAAIYIYYIVRHRKK